MAKRAIFEFAVVINRLSKPYNVSCCNHGFDEKWIVCPSCSRNGQKANSKLIEKIFSVQRRPDARVKCKELRVFSNGEGLFFRVDKAEVNAWFFMNSLFTVLNHSPVSAFDDVNPSRPVFVRICAFEQSLIHRRISPVIWFDY